MFPPMAAVKSQSTSAKKLDSLFACVRMVSCPDEVRSAVNALREAVNKGQLSRYRRGERLPAQPTRERLADLTKALDERYRLDVAGWDDAAA